MHRNGFSNPISTLGAAGLAAASLMMAASAAPASEHAASAFQEQVLPLLENRCFDCHGYGAEEGSVSLDPDESGAAVLEDTDLWARALRSVRAGIMPPDGYDRPEESEVSELAGWVKRYPFAIDDKDPDPGAVTLRRLNRAEYGATIRDLMGVDYNVEVQFPPDDTGYGFDNVGDALSLSPLLVEKYLDAAATIVERAVPMRPLEPPSVALRGGAFREADGDTRGWNLDLDKAVVVRKRHDAPVAGDYRIEVKVRRHSSFEYNPSRANVAFLVDGGQLQEAEHYWDENVVFNYEFPLAWKAGEHELAFEVRPLPPADAPEDDGEASLVEDEGYARLAIDSVRIVGPLDEAHRVPPPSYGRFFPRPEPPTDPDERRAYAREVLTSFTRKAFRRPPDDATLDRLVELAQAGYSAPGATFERGVADAMTAALASSRFLFRQESPDPRDADARYPLLDEHALASRLSYFFWGSCPDDGLNRLADEGRLRENLDAQVERMTADPRWRDTQRRFVDQWLRAQDAEHVPLNTLAILGVEQEWREVIDELRSRGFRRMPDGQPDPVRDRFFEIRKMRETLDARTRSLLRREVETHFEKIVEEDRSLLEMIDCDYAYLNETLARYYGVEGVEGNEIRRVALDEQSVRGGVLTAGATLMVTSNPTRTSPVKRGLFVLENLLGTPPPPPPPNVPELEDAKDDFGDRDPPLRELLALHRESPLCSSCHQRMDPLGLALENFNALGQWRERDGDATIDPAGRLVSGEDFASLDELKKLLVGPRRLDYYRCVTRKLMTFALGRGIEPHDQHTIDQIVERLDAEGGRFDVLLEGVVQSPAFQRMRRPVN